MNIGLSTSVIQRGRSGVAQYVFALVAALSRQAGRHGLTLFVLEKDVPLFDFARKSAKIISVPERFRPPVKDIFWHQTVLPSLVRTYRLDVLHVPSYRRMLWPRPCALVTTIHDLAPFHIAGKYDWKRMLYGRVVARWLAHRQDKVIAVSQNTAADILGFFKLPAKNVSVVHNGLDHTRFYPESTEDAKQFVEQHFGLRQPFFLYVARLEHPGKNHVRLIEAFNRFKAATGSKWQLVLGGSDWHGAPAIHTAVGQSPFSDDIRCLGFVGNDALPLLYRAAEVFVYPSLFEGFGFPPLEAMACGCPVLCSTRGALGEIVGDAVATVDPDDVTALKTQLAALASSPALRAKLRVSGLERAQCYDWQRTAAKTLEVYTAALQIGTAPGRVTAAHQEIEN
ncbi:MAG: glycosyltransferase family 4 protein [Akkermansiaceae bacterium]|nr:glycosyltransferase family 4 protein [Verrucomicrobiales bacterium]